MPCGDGDRGQGGGGGKPPPLVHATANDQKLTEPTPSVAWTGVWLTRHTVHGTWGNTWCTILKAKGKLCHQSHYAQISFLDTKDEHHAPQN